MEGACLEEEEVEGAYREEQVAWHEKEAAYQVGEPYGEGTPWVEEVEVAEAGGWHTEEVVEQHPIPFQV